MRSTHQLCALPRKNLGPISLPAAPSPHTPRSPAVSATSELSSHGFCLYATGPLHEGP